MSTESSILGAVGRATALVVLDSRGRVQHWSDGATQLWGWNPEECLGRNWTELGTMTDSVRQARSRALLEAVLAGATRDFEWTSRRASGDAVRLHTMVTPLVGPDDSIIGAVCLSLDTSSREGFEQALVRAALHDQLTGLPGRSLFVHEVGVALADRRGPHRAAVLFIDLDRFKRVNDEHGHAAGDEVLVAIAQRLRTAVRDGDLVARLGGDEFAVLVRLDRASNLAADLAERISRGLAEPIAIAGGTVEVGASIGVALAGPDDEAEDVLARADAAMYRAKRSEPVDPVVESPAVSASGPG